MTEMPELLQKLSKLHNELESDVLLCSTREQHVRAVLRLGACEEIIKMLDSSHE